MLLFIDRLPFQEVKLDYTPTRGTNWRISVITWKLLLPVVMTEPDADPTDAIQRDEAGLCRPWKFDTACNLESSCYRWHLEKAGIDPDVFRCPKEDNINVTFANDEEEELPVRPCSLWLLSNVTALRDRPCLLELLPGIPFFDRTTSDPARRMPLLGLRAMRRAGLKVEIDFGEKTVSVWTPSDLFERVGLTVKRKLRGKQIEPSQVWSKWE